MNTEILFLRHGKAKRPDGVDDFDRPLKTRGRRQAHKIGRWLAGNDALPDAVLCSPAQRAVETANVALRAAGLDPSMVRTDRRLYFDSRGALMDAIAAFDGAGARVLVVGHNPWMEDLVCGLADTPPEHPGGSWIMKTGTLMRFAVSDLKSGLGKGRGRMLDYVLAGELADTDD